MSRKRIGPSVSFFAFQDIITAVVGIFILITLTMILELVRRVERAESPAAVNVREVRETIASLRSETERLSAIYQTRLEAANRTADVNSFNRESKIREEVRAISALRRELQQMNAKAASLRQRLESEQVRQQELAEQSSILESTRQQAAALQEQIKSLEEQRRNLAEHSGPIYRDTLEDGRSVTVIVLSDQTIETLDGLRRRKQVFRGEDCDVEFAAWLDAINTAPRHFLLLVKPSGAPLFRPVKSLLNYSGAVHGFDVVRSNTEVRLSYEYEGTP